MALPFKASTQVGLERQFSTFAICIFWGLIKRHVNAKVIISDISRLICEERQDYQPGHGPVDLSCPPPRWRPGPQWWAPPCGFRWPWNVHIMLIKYVCFHTHFHLLDSTSWWQLIESESILEFLNLVWEGKGRHQQKKKRFLSGIARMRGGGGLPMPENCLALFQEVHFWSIKRVYFFKNANVLNF